MAEYIEREDAIGAFDNVDADVMEDYGDGADFGFGYRLICDTLKAVPAADVAPVVHGQWLIVKGSNGKEYHACSHCSHEQEVTGVKNFCAVCGARMDGGSVNE